MKTNSALAAIALLTLIVQESSLAALILNGSFEDSVQPDPIGFKVVIAGSKDIASWEITGHSVDLEGPYWSASDGAKSIDLNGIDAGRIQQSFVTEPGAKYRATFDIAGNPYGPPMVMMLQVWARPAGQQFYFDTSGKTPTSMGWQRVAFEFMAFQTLTTLELESLVSGPRGPAVDNISVEMIADGGNRVLSISSNTDYLSVPDNDSLDLVSTFSLEAWINPSRIVSQEQVVISKLRSPTGTGVELRTFAKGASLAFNNDPGNNTGINLVFGGGDTLASNTWHHLAATYDGTLAKVYTCFTPRETRESLMFSGLFFIFFISTGWLQLHMQ